MPITRIFEESQAETAGALIRQGGLVVFPTETVYGLGADATDPAAVARIFQAKGRPQDNPLIVHVAAAAQLDQVARGANDLARALVALLMPGPLTLILPRAPGLAPAVTAGKETVGLRIPGCAVARRFLAAAGVPVAAPSANRSGRPSPTSFAMARAEMEGRADAILGGPEATVGLESTIVWPADDRILKILRPGGISPETLRDACARAGFPAVEISGADAGVGGAVPAAPGTRYRHYSPQARVRLFRDAGELAGLLAAAAAGPDGRGGVTLLAAELCPAAADASTADGAIRPPPGAAVTHRSRFASLDDYARLLYRELTEADQRGSSLILAWLPESGGIGLALRDRLERAAGKTGS